MQEAVAARIRYVWKKFKETARVLCKRVVSLKLRGSLYKSCVSSVLCYGADCWTLKTEDERNMQITAMRMLCVICGKTLRDSISNETICEMIGVEKIQEFLREERLHWFRHLEKVDGERALVKANNFVVDGSESSRRNKRLKETIEKRHAG